MAGGVSCVVVCRFFVVVCCSPLAFLNAGGGYGNTGVVSYTECLPGTKVSGLDCEDCPSGYVSTTRNALECLACVGGTATLISASASACVSCPPGTYSESGSSVCTNCTAGRSNSAPNQIQCALCFAGTFSAMNASRECTSCQAGRYTSNSGQTSCTGAVAGSFSANGLTQQLCPSGTFSNTSQSAQCLECMYFVFGFGCCSLFSPCFCISDF